ncbi:lipase member I-like [Agrilus planipennis]|uniref:Lipase member I-like n=1 Tax=Agrilus planipennis TaxID=224129 RepID=A0A1W4WWM4_AGRPL|nr:lipase member I-like [Agrilus planipennis]
METIVKIIVVSPIFIATCCSLSIETNENVLITLYTKNSNPKQMNDKNIYTVDTSKHTIFIIPGWRSYTNETWLMNLTRNYFEKGDFNVFIVDWTNYSFSYNYLKSYNKVGDVGKVVANSILMMTGSSETFLNNVHLIGHSLGAHVCGFVGQEVYKVAFYKLARITGLDPAKPGYETPMKIGFRYRLTEYSAQFVDVIHTNGGVLGFAGSMGTADFYPNGGGPTQPGCAVMDEVCSHRMAYYFFMESILSNNFVAKKCASWDLFSQGKCNKSQKAVMGESVSLTTRGKFFLKTNPQPPFAIII